jgi:hypothetical protein
MEANARERIDPTVHAERGHGAREVKARRGASRVVTGADRRSALSK